MANFFATIDTAIMGRKTLDAGLKMSGGSLPRFNMPMYVFSNSKPPGGARWRYLRQRNAFHFYPQAPPGAPAKTSG